MTDITILNNQIEEHKPSTWQTPIDKIAILVNALRLVSNDSEIQSRELYIPEDCEEYGFSEGYHNLGELLHFLADMLEE